MIRVQLSKQDFAYDVQALCKAFYPNEAIVIEEAGTGNVLEAEGFRLQIELQESSIRVRVFERKECLYEREAAAVYKDRKSYKNVLKKLVYQALSEKTEALLPWGTLTGVRPSKLAMERLEQGETEEEVASFMKNHYLCSEEKVALALSIAKKELQILKDLDYKNGYSVYIGIPFCPSRCLYCSFTSYSLEQYQASVEAYLEALFLEIDYAATCLPKKQLTTIYIGGGTPTTLSAEQLKRLLQKVKTSFPMETVREFTVEAGRPDSITIEKLEVLKAEGVNRISINPQTMKQATLDFIGRRHSVKEVMEAFQMAREVGHTNINMDLIAGLPGENLVDMRDTLQQMEALEPDSITVHSLVVKRAAELNLQKGQENKIGLYDTKDMLEEAAKFAKKQGYEPYYMYRQKNATGRGSANQENIGYAKPGSEGIYNILIMEEKQTILALGAGGASKFVFPNGERIERVETVKSVKDYIERIQEMIARKRTFLEANKESF